MADVFVVNAVPTQTYQWWSLWRLTSAMTQAGWQIKGVGDGTNYNLAGQAGVPDPIVRGGAHDLWSSFPGGGGSASGAWYSLYNPTLDLDVLFWRSTTSNDNGKIIVAKDGAISDAGFASASATSPGTIPAGADYLRGSAGVFTPWMGGGTNTVGHVHVAVRDITTGAGAFWILGSTPGYGAASWAHHLRFDRLDPMDSTQGADAEPYVFFSPNSATGNWPNFYLTNLEYTNDGAAGTSGYFWGYRAAGTWSQFGGFVLSNGGGYAHSIAPTDPYSSPGTYYWLERVAIGKQQTGQVERKGWLQNSRFCTTTIANCDVFGTLTWAKFGTGGSVLFWDGVTAVPVTD